MVGQSIGGGGGSGGFNISAVGSGAGTASGAVSVGIGGNGGGGGKASAVVVATSKAVQTMGNQSTGVLAQSVGGGGGNGGFNISAGGSGVAEGNLSGGIAVGVGGKGGVGGDAGTVNLTVNNTVYTQGNQSSAAVAQSIGGGGGNGGFSISGAFTLGGGAVSVSVGGSGGIGGMGEAVTLNSNVGTPLIPGFWNISTAGESANGIEAQSIGGGGGNGGFSGAITGSGNAKASISASIGGFGAAGNRAGSVMVNSDNNILTQGDRSNGIIAQSIGGGGGNGGFSFAGTLSVPTGNSLSLSASLGGFGGSAGDADTVTVNASGTISTMGNNANGVIAQSLGGGGGNGGLSVAGTFNFASMNNVPSITASVGGFGGSGGAGKAVTVTRTGVTTTVGDNSIGILAQSIGGGGGNGGLSIAGSIGGPDAKQISASVGGFGGPGSGAGDVTVSNTGAITTGSITMQQEQIAALGTVFITVPVVTGNGSGGILAQSIGGGGGNGGFAFSGSIGPTGENTSVNVGLTVGGFGGSGGTAGNVKVTNVGAILTNGANANGIEAQSLGGGGGNGGSALTGQIAAGDPQSGGKSVNVAVSVGGKGGDGNIAGSVFVEQTGGVTTNGPGSDGILAQSIGGGGGTGGGANSLSLQLATSGTFQIPFVGADKQITGFKPPKNPSVNVQVDVGGFGGTGNDGNTVTVLNHSFITTQGDSSSGIVAQSIGGGGGNGGQAIVGLTGLFPNANYVDIATSVITLPIGTTSTLTGIGKITVGGFGGAAGDGATVSVTNNGVIQTSGSSAYGIEAQSIGGGGGSGGNASSGVTGAVSVGGFGMASGKGGDVTVTNTAGANISTSGQSSAAIFAQSIGGGGGDGGTAGGLVALGGFGGASGGGGVVMVGNDAALQTSGDHAIGILAQSTGGGGGNGGGTGLSGIAIGGLAGALGSTGDGGAVTVRNTSTATILTMGDGAHGIEAQSVGGGGGNGGGSTLAAAVTVGGHGGSSGAGGKVQIFNDGMVETMGSDAIGVFGQSIGGSGGSGGGSIVSAVTVGGFGGSSGGGGEVDITNTAAVLTLGAGSDAIRGQSIGGGGGNAGGVGQSVGNGGLGLGLLVSVGGSGGGGGDGGAVNIINSSTLMTKGDKADGIYAQSVGGGGGEGGRAIGLVAVGGGGGNTGNGGSVSVTNNTGGMIVTQGMMSDGIFAQSVGGGGGDGGGAYSGSPIGFSTSVGGVGSGGGAGGTVKVDNYGLIQTGGASSQAIFAQSVGGGGGNGAYAGSFNGALPSPAVGVSVGGNGGGGGNGGTVTVNNYAGGSIVANGASSTAIFAQSVGGGGGNGGYAMTVSASVLGSVGVAVGGNGGAGGSGGAVTVSNVSSVTINGKNSLGIMAQSVGGGGGTASASLGVAVIPVFIGGQNGANGTGGAVTVTNTGSITVNGNNSIGIFAQSVGGGGGMVMPGSGATSVVSESGGTGNGGVVTINNTAGSIIINGANSIAMYSQSIGGGGGAVGLAADPPGQVGAFMFSGAAGGSGAALPTVMNQTGNLIATGANSIAVVAQSDAAGGKGDITVNISNSAKGLSLILGGLGNGGGISVLNGANNTVNNAGVIAGTPNIVGTITGVSSADGTFTVVAPSGAVSTVSGIGGYAIRGTSGNDAVNNTGVVVGSVDLGAGVNKFSNHTNALLAPGPLFLLGDSANQLINDGTLVPGGMHLAQHTDMTGSFVQSATGTTFAELDFRSSVLDQIYMTGTAKLAGKVDVSLLNPQLVPYGHFQKTLFSANQGVTNDGMVLSAAPSVVITYQLLYPTGYAAVLDYNVDFSPKDSSGRNTLGRNLQEVGNYFNRIQSAGSSSALADTIIKLLYDPTIEAYKQTLSQMSPDFYGEHQAEFIRGNQRFGQMLLEGGPYRFGPEGRMFWFSYENEDAMHDAYDDYKAVTLSTERFAIGLEKEFGDHWTAGLGYSMEQNKGSGYSGSWSSSGLTEHLGASIKRAFGGTEVAGILSYGWNETDSTRTGQVTSPFVAKMTRDLEAFDAMLRVSHEFTRDGFYLRPKVDVGMTHLNARPGSESGAGAISLQLGSYQETHAWIRPAFGVGDVFTLRSGARVHLHAEVDYQYYLSGKYTYVRASFAGAPTGVSPMDVPIEVGSFLNTTVGMDLITNKNVTFGVQYKKSIDKHYDMDLVSFKVSIPF
ncbi:MAG: autotransporter outer membrane beta-barrel domain-containing protein [Chthoniobacteraceae bacterium]